MAFNTFASATTAIPLANLDANFTAIGTSAAASTLYPTATTSITYGSSNTVHIFNTAASLGVGTATPNAYGQFVSVSNSINNIIAAASSSTSVTGFQTQETPGVRCIAMGTYGSTYAGGSVFNVGAGGSFLFQQSAAPLGIGTFAVAQPLIFGTNSSERMRIDATGNVGIGTTAPTYKLQLSTDSAAKPSTNTWTIASDERIKNVTGEYTKGLDAVCALRPVTYEYNGAAGFEADGKENISIIAQEAIQHFPECVGTFNAKLNETDEAETELYNWNGHALTFALVNAVKELKAELDIVKAELAALKAA